MSVTANSGVSNGYTITADLSSSNDPSTQTTHAVKLVISPPSTYSSDQTAVSVNFNTVVTTPSCNCDE
jgi:hypothetical protein